MKLLYKILRHFFPSIDKRIVHCKESELPERVLEVTTKHPDGHITLDRIGTAYLQRDEAWQPSYAELENEAQTKPHRDHKKEIEEGLARQARNEDWKRRKYKREYKKLQEEAKKPKRIHVSEITEAERHEEAKKYSKILNS